MKKFLLIIFSLLCVINVCYASGIPKKIVKINLSDKDRQTVNEIFNSGLDIVYVNPAENYINVLLTESEIQKLRQKNISPEIQLEDANAFARQLRHSGYLENFHTFDEMYREMLEITTQYPNIATILDIGDSYEKTTGKGGYDIWVIKISDNVSVEENEPEVFYMANMHAREIITPEIIMYFMHYLVENYGVDPYVTFLVDHRQIWLCPSMNPDGHEYVFTGSEATDMDDPMWWRKNKQDNNNNGIFDPGEDGVDLNRNFGYKWGWDDTGSNPDLQSNIYRGKSAFSEPETRAIRDFTLAHDFRITLSFHSQGQLWLFPWGYAAMNTEDHSNFVALADSCTAYNNYDPITIAELYLTNGNTDDWFYGEQNIKNKIFAFTVEVGNHEESVGEWTGFFPDTTYIEKQILENQGPMLYLAYASGEEPIIESQTRSTFEPEGPYRLICTIRSPVQLTQSVPLDSSSFKLYYSTTGNSPFDSTSLSATGIADQYEGFIPEKNETEKIYYYLAAADNYGRTGYAPRAAKYGALYSFKLQQDTYPPVIQHVPVADQSYHTKSIQIKTQISDDSEIKEAWIIYKVNSAPVDSILMQNITFPGEFIGYLQFDSLNIGDIISYQIKTIDASRKHNVAFNPSMNFHQFEILDSYFFDFETDNGNFSTNENSDWQWGRPVSEITPPFPGKNVWATSLHGNYGNNSDSWLDTPQIDLQNAVKANLKFWHWYHMEFSHGILWDGGNVKISVNGNPFQLLEPDAGYDGSIDPVNSIMADEYAFGGEYTNGNYWHEESFDLNDFVGDSIKIRFLFSSDNNTTNPGWYIDNVQINFKTAEYVSIDQEETKPDDYYLYQNFPNPFNPETVISYNLAKNTKVTLKIYNILGQEIRTLYDKLQPNGIHKILWNGKDDNNQPVGSGIYFYKIITDDFSKSRKMLLLK